MNEVLIDIICCFAYYSLLGWIIESVFKSIRDKGLVNSGFLSGPFCPVYGFGAILIIQSAGMVDNASPSMNIVTALVLKLVIAIAAVSLLEYLTAVLLEKLFACKWWDYSDQAFNIQGRICLKYSFFWGILACLLIEFIHPINQQTVALVPVDVKYCLVSLIVVYFALDLIKSVNDVWELQQYIALPQLNLIEENLHKYKRLISAFPQLCFYELKRLNKYKSSINEDKMQDIEEYKTCIDDLIFHDQIQMMKQFRHHRYTNCFEHSVRVSFYSFRVCKALGWDYKSAARGGLLHDLFLYDWRTTQLEGGKHGFVHPRIAFNNASNVFTLNNIEKDIILKHMFPLTMCPPFYKESLLVCLVDKYCALAEIVASILHFPVSSGSCARLGYL